MNKSDDMIFVQTKKRGKGKGKLIVTEDRAASAPAVCVSAPRRSSTSGTSRAFSEETVVEVFIDPRFDTGYAFTYSGYGFQYDALTGRFHLPKASARPPTTKETSL